MAYVEWLRVKKMLLVLAIVLGVLFVIAAVVRVSVNQQLNADSWLHLSSGSHATSKALPGGATETTIVEGDKTVVVTDHGWAGKHIVETTTKPQTVDGKKQRNVNIGPFQVHSISPTRTELDTDGPVDVGKLFGFLVLFGALFATILAAPLARENERLEVAWTKPIDRTLYGIQLYGVDIVGIIAGMVMIEIACIAAYSLFQAPHLTISATGLWKIAIAIAAASTWYAMYAALTSWMKRGFGAFIGVAWPVGLFVPGLALIPLNGTTIGQIFHWIFRVLATVDPFAYLQLSIGMTSRQTGLTGLPGLDDPIKLGILLLLALVYAGAGLIEWRRVEA